MWAGGTPSLGDFPSTLKDFLKVLISADGPRAASDPHANALGNHLGIWDFYFEKFNHEKKIKLYHQHLFEDSSGLRFANRYDGLWGFELVDKMKKSNFLPDSLQIHFVIILEFFLFFFKASCHFKLGSDKTPFQPKEFSSK